MKIISLGGLVNILLSCIISSSYSPPFIGNNVHQIAQDVYRTAQLDEKDLEDFIRRTEIKSYINLRGENKGRSWYDSELVVCDRLDVTHHDVKLSAREMPERQKLIDLVDILENLEISGKPYAIHCDAGIDRTGFGAALVYILKGYSVDDAKSKAFKLRFGYVKRRKFSELIKVLDVYKHYQSQMSFKEWVGEFYRMELAVKN